ncbi:MAG: hypothetical protein GF311_25355 [Candidatus Lokiarchaeota archaeon]|nr:hypothetical protein [Candidatus Lokiarchaeota archaeon]
MSKRRSSGKGIAIVALALVIGTIGFLLYSMVILEPESTIRGTWYDSNETRYNTNPTLTLITIPDLSITFEKQPGESVYILFSSRAGVWEDGGWEYIEVYLAIDGNRINEANNKFLLYTSSGGSANIVPMTLQYTANELSNGVHEVTVIIYGSHSSNYVDSNTLLVQTYAG